MQNPPPRRPIINDPKAAALAQDIDRSKCTRVVPMKVLGLGVSRTGTSSLRQALLDLDYHDVYHYASIGNENPRDATLWLRALDAKFPSDSKTRPPPFEKEDWDALLGHCMALTDTPCTIFYRELLSTYPDAKVVLTVRDSAAQWWESQMGTIMTLVSRPSRPPKWVGWFMPKERDVDVLGREAMLRYPMYRALYGDLVHGTREAERWYERYVEEIRRLVPEERLLVMNIKEGWKPLCEFLGCQVPPWEFPRVNTGDEFLQNIEIRRKKIGRIVMWNMVKTLVPLTAVGVVAGAWFWNRFLVDSK